MILTVIGGGRKTGRQTDRESWLTGRTPVIGVDAVRLAVGPFSGSGRRLVQELVSIKFSGSGGGGVEVGVVGVVEISHLGLGRSSLGEWRVKLL